MPIASSSAYERKRMANIAKNNAKLAELGLADGIVLPGELKRPAAASRKRKRAPSAAPQRRSARAQRQPPEIYSASHVEADRAAQQAQRLAEQSSGHRDANGRWRGERFGSVPGVPVGTVFGAGDYQRKGRFEMSGTGFHAGHVQPEWLDADGRGCYSLILNNDNGLSQDSGRVFTYAGAGGRRRGQNRTAAQSFDQSWDSAVNTALRTSFQNQNPVRVIRGPKLASSGSTASSGGGFRYDGLFHVSKAEMVRTGAKRLLTCMFTLEKL